MKALLAVFCLLLAGCDQLSASKNVAAKEELPHYQLVVDNNGNAWRLDTVSGEMKRCWQGTPGSESYPPSCYTAVQK